MEAKVWSKEDIQKLVVTNDKAAVKALLTIYAKQTESEKASDATHEHNSVGFTAFDAEVLTSFAKFYQRVGFLTDNQMSILKKKIGKYWRQLLASAEAKGACVSYKVKRSGN